VKANYVIWRYQDVKGACVLESVQGLERAYRLCDGTPLAEGFPSGVNFHMNPDFPDDMLLLDNVRNPSMCLVASKRLQERLRSEALAYVEFLPVEIIDHKGRVASRDHAIVHPIEPVDAIDKDQSIFETSFIDENDIDSFKRLVLNEAAIPDDRHLFRLKGFWNITLVRRSLAEALAKEKFSGLSWLEIDAYPEV
jgi:hypothetical protein